MVLKIKKLILFLSLIILNMDHPTFYLYISFLIRGYSSIILYFIHWSGVVYSTSTCCLRNGHLTTEYHYWWKWNYYLIMFTLKGYSLSAVWPRWVRHVNCSVLVLPALVHVTKCFWTVWFRSVGDPFPIDGSDQFSMFILQHLVQQTK
jgi:hypothetical protein